MPHVVTLLAADAARIIKEILEVVAQCHAKNVVIRDVKPENFLFLDSSPQSPLKAIDFGIAAYCAPDETLTDRAGVPCNAMLAMHTTNQCEECSVQRAPQMQSSLWLSHMDRRRWPM